MPALKLSAIAIMILSGVALSTIGFTAELRILPSVGHVMTDEACELTLGFSSAS
jgi:hypothetical protein